MWGLAASLVDFGSLDFSGLIFQYCGKKAAGSRLGLMGKKKPRISARYWA